jgi:hypothetical protein
MAMTPDQQKAIAIASARLRLQSQESVAPELQPEAPSAMVRTGRGMMDMVQGIKQMGLMASDAFTGKNEADAYTKQVGDEIAKYETGRGKDAGFDWMRLAGNIAITLPLPGGVGGTATKRAITGGAAGATQGGLMFTPEGESKAGQIATGAIVGAAVPMAVERVAGMVRGGTNRAANAVADVTRRTVDDMQIQNTVANELKLRGVDFNTLTQQAQNALRQEARAQLQMGPNLNADALTRIAQAAQLDPRLAPGGTAGLTRGQATRMPQDWQTEQNLRSIQGVGDDLRERFARQGLVLGESAERIRGGTRAPTDRPYQAGEQAIGAIKKKFEETGDEVSALYRAARETVGAQADVPLAPLQGRGMQVLNEFDDVIPAPIKSRLYDLGVDRMGPVQPKRAFTVEEAEALDRLINKRWDASNKPMTAALSELKGALRDSLDQVGSDPGTAAAEAFKAAKGQAKARFDEFGQKIARSATDDVAPDKFVRRFVTGGDVRDIQKLVKTLTTGTPEQMQRGAQALNSIRAATLTEMFEGSGKAAGALQDGVLSGTKLRAIMKDIGPERLNAIFTPDQVRSLERLRGVSLDLTNPPPLSDINYSRTASALANLLNSIGKVPGLGVAARIAQSETERVQRTAAEQALRGSAAAAQRAPVEAMNAAQQNALARQVAPFAVPVANALAYQQNQ